MNNVVPSWSLRDGDVKFLSAADDYYRIEVKYYDASGSWQSAGTIDIGHAFLKATGMARQWRYYDESQERWINYNGNYLTELYYINA